MSARLNLCFQSSSHSKSACVGFGTSERVSILVLKTSTNFNVTCSDLLEGFFRVAVEHTGGTKVTHGFAGKHFQALITTYPSFLSIWIFPV